MTLLNSILQNDTVKVLVLDNHKTAFEYIKEPNTIIALFAIAVSIIGLWISVRYNRKTLEHTIKHSKLSVEPILTLHTKYFEYENYISVNLFNKGLGTASITSISIDYLGDEYTNFEDLLKENDFCETRTDDEECSVETFNCNSTTHISSNEDITLCSFKATTNVLLDPIIEMLQVSKIKIDYISMYGDKKRLINVKLLTQSNIQ